MVMNNYCCEVLMSVVCGVVGCVCDVFLQLLIYCSNSIMPKARGVRSTGAEPFTFTRDFLTVWIFLSLVPSLSSCIFPVLLLPHPSN